MLPTILLQPVELGTPGKSLDTADLLPSDATEPTALFADLLRISAEPVQPDMPPRGIGLPEGGNALPTSLDSGLGTVPEVLVDEPLTSLPAAVRAELTPNSTPTPTPTPTAAGVTPEILRPAPIPAPVAAQLVEITDLPDPVLPETVRRLAPIAAEVATDTGAEELQQLRNGPPVERQSRTPVEDGLRPLIRSDDKPVATPAPARVPEALPEMKPLADARRPEAPSTRLAEMMRADNAAEPRVVRSDLPASTSIPPTAPAPQVSAVSQPLPTPVPDIPVITATTPAASPTPTPIAAPPVTMPLDVATPAPQLHTAIDVPVQDTAWGERLGERVQLMASGRLQSAEIRLSPAELGPLRVQVAVDDGNATVTFHAQHAVTREAIEQALPRLRELLAETGLNLNQASVSDQGVQNGGRQAGDAGRDSSASQQADAEGAAEELFEGADETARESRRPQGLLDTFV